MNSLLSRFLLGLATVLCLASPLAAQYQAGQVPVEQTAGWAIVESGRMKPLDSFARDLIVKISGKRLEMSDGVTPLELVWGFHFSPEDFSDRPYIRVDNDDLKVLMGLDKSERRFSFNTLAASEVLNTQANNGFAKDREDQQTTPVERDAMRVWNKLGLLSQVRSGSLLALVPIEGEDGGWTPVNALTSLPDGAPGKSLEPLFRDMRVAFLGGDSAAFGAAAATLGTNLRQLGPDLYPAQSKMDLELKYNRWDTFGKAAWLFLIGFLLILAFARAEKRTGYFVGMGFVGLGFVGQTLGIGMRWAIAGRAPVSDMYESLVFMGWGVIAIGLVLELIYRRGYFGMATSILGFLALAFARWLPPTVMDSSISPLMPVLRNTSWLSIHVMTIMLSYSAFALAMGMGHIVMFKQLYQPGRTNQLRTLSALLNKTIQVGVFFLAAGIAFGAIWANESWGRYWGWDPKETWSAITFFVYLAVIHARYAGWIHQYGLAVCSVVSFMFVLFTYYGVNFVLGAGLHAYGRGSGGMWYVGGYLALELAIILAGWFSYQAAIRSGKIVKPTDD